MSTFTTECYQNEYLQLGASEVNAIVTIASPTPDRLAGLSTPVAKAAELHMMTMEDTVAGGLMRMRPLAGLIATTEPL